MRLDRRAGDPRELEERRLQFARLDQLVARSPSLRTRHQPGVELDLDLVGDLQGAEQRRIGRDSPLGLVDDDVPLRVPPSPTTRSNATGRVSPTSVSSPRTFSRPPPAASTAVERNEIACPFRTSSSIVVSMLALSSRPSGCIPPVPSRTRRDVGIDVEHDARLRWILTDLECRLPGGCVDQEIVSGLRSRAGAPGPHREGAVLGPERMRACRERHRRTLVVGSVTVSRSPSRATSPPSARINITATAAPRSRCSSPRTIGAALSSDRLEHHLRPVDGDLHLGAAVPRRGQLETRKRALHRVGLDHDRGTGAGCPCGRQLERVGLACHGLVAAALDPRRERQQLEQGRKLVRGTVDEAEIPLQLLLFEILEPDHRLREPLHRCERCPEVVTGERNETCEIGVQSAASVTA